MTQNTFNPYIYKAKVVDVYDGDSITLDISLGFGVELKGQKVRLHGINSPELHVANSTAGEEAREWLKSQILGKDVVIESIKDKKEKYGRWLVKIYLDDTSSESLNDEIVKVGHAVKATY